MGKKISGGSRFEGNLQDMESFAAETKGCLDPFVVKRLPRLFIRRDEVLDLHLQRQSDTAKLICGDRRRGRSRRNMRLLEFAGSEDEVARCYFVAEGFTDLRDPKWHLPIKFISAEEAQQ